MTNKLISTQNEPQSHFVRRAKNYNLSSNWVDDASLIERIRNLAGVNSESYVLDIGIGTGKVSQSFQGLAHYVVGVDICAEMVRQAKGCADRIILTPAENLPFKKGVFDVCVCRQGLQFMDLDNVFSEMRRVLKRGGQVVLCHLTAYGKEDKDETFFIQKLRNPARKNFFLPDDFLGLLGKNGFTDIESFEYLTRESINRWINNAAIGTDARKKIIEIYKNASFDFKKRHDIRFKERDIFDTMKMFLVKARKETNA